MDPPGWSARLNQWHWIQWFNDTVYTVPQSERVGRFQNGGKCTCAARCCNMWLFNKECQYILEKINKRKKQRWWVKPWIMRRNMLGASNTLLIQWTSEDRDTYKNHLRMSREQFVKLLSKVRRYTTNWLDF
jgi:hypothetical protein